MKLKTLNDLLKALQTLSPDELQRPIVYSSDNLCLSGYVYNFGKAKSTLYWNGDEDPSQLRTKKVREEYGYDKEEIDEFDLEIKKGDFVIKF